MTNVLRLRFLLNFILKHKLHVRNLAFFSADVVFTRYVLQVPVHVFVINIFFTCAALSLSCCVAEPSEQTGCRRTEEACFGMDGLLLVKDAMRGVEYIRAVISSRLSITVSS